MQTGMHAAVTLRKCKFGVHATARAAHTELYGCKQHACAHETKNQCAIEIDVHR